MPWQPGGMRRDRTDPIRRLEPDIRRIASARLTDRDDIDDVVQETLTRLYEVRDRLELATLTSYAAITARNLAISMQRDRAVAERRAPGLFDPSAPADPEEHAVRSEEHDALVAALSALREEERRALVEHDALEVPTAAIAERQATTPGTMATRLARARARVRVEFLFAYRRLRPTSPECRPVLYALATGEKRRQRELKAGDHIARCDVCAQLVEPLSRRSRKLAALAPFALVGKRLRSVGRAARAHPVASAGAGIVAVAAAVALTASLPDSQPTAARATLSVDGTKAMPIPKHFAWGDHEGDAVRAQGAPVHSVPHDEGLWLGLNGRERVWVELEVSGESGPRVRAGAKVWFRGRLVRNEDAWLRGLGLSPRDGLGLLRRQGFHIVVRAQGLRTSS